MNDFVKVCRHFIDGVSEVKFIVVQAARIHCGIKPTIPVIADADTGYASSLTTLTSIC